MEQERFFDFNRPLDGPYQFAENDDQRKEQRRRFKLYLSPEQERRKEDRRAHD